MITNKLRTFIVNTCSSLIGDEEKLEVNIYFTTKTVTIQIITSEQNRGKLIGKHGRTINALHLLCTSIKGQLSNSDKRSIRLEILEDNNEETSPKN